MSLSFIITLLNVLSLCQYADAPCLSEALPNDNYLEIKDHRVYYEKSGVGEAVLLIHGGYLDRTMWNDQVSYLNDKGYMTITFDDVGHGKTVAGQEKLYGYEIVEALLQKCDVDTINIVGLSWGAMLAVDFSLMHPDKVKKLILLSPGLSGWDYFKDKNARKNFELRQTARDNNDKDLFVEYFQKNWTDGPDQDSLRVDPDVRSKVKEMMDRNATDHWQEDWSTLAEPPAIEKLAELQPETLIVTGKLDGKDIQMIAEKMEGEIKNVRRIEVEDVAHTLNLEKPTETNKIIADFLEK